MASQMVSFASNGGSAEGYLVEPPGGRGPGLIVVQEWWGLNDNIRGIAERFAAAGFLALAPDLYHGQVTAEPDEAQKMMMALRMDGAAKDMSGAYDYLAGHPAGTGKVGSIGFCLGGGLSLYISTLKPIDATVIFYGALPGAQPDVSRLQGPVLGHYAEHDSFATPEAASALEKQLGDLGKSVEFYRYPGTSHAFFNDAGSAYDAAAASTAWERTLAFLQRQLA